MHARFFFRKTCALDFLRNKQARHGVRAVARPASGGAGAGAGETGIETRLLLGLPANARVAREHRRRRASSPARRRRGCDPEPCAGAGREYWEEADAGNRVLHGHAALHHAAAARQGK